MRQSLKSPIPEIFDAYKFMSEAVDAHLAGNGSLAAHLFEKANFPILQDWLYPEWEKCHLNVIDKHPLGDTQTIPKAARDPKRHLLPHEMDNLILRDGYCCRYCGIPLIKRKVYEIARQLYPIAVPWDGSDWRKRHMGFESMWLQFDHVVPHSHGGLSNEDNSVVCCALCNFGKDKYTLRQLHMVDPRSRSVVKTPWDGLERLMASVLLCWQ